MIISRAMWAVMLAAVMLASTAIAEFHMLPMTDGVKLATDVVLPEVDGPFPTVLVRSTYNRPLDPAPLFNGQGIAYVVQHTRGRGDSEGIDLAFEDDGWGEHRDGAETVDWIRAQDWSNGKVGTFGASALGITQVRLAGASQNIAAQAIWVSASNFYGQLAYQGGVFRKSLSEYWLTGQKSAHVIDRWKAHPTYDDFWKGFDSDARAELVTAPGVHVGGWWDIFQQGTLRGFTERQYRGGEGARGNQKLIIGPWLHGPVPKPGDLKLNKNYKFDFMGYSARFLTNWLVTPNGIMDEPAIHYYTLGDVDDPDAPGNEWRTADAWPPVPTETRRLYLHEDGALAWREHGKSGSTTYRFDPADPVPTHGGPNLFADRVPTGPMDQRPLADREDILRYSTKPLDEPIEITGEVSVELYVSTSGVDTDFTAKLVDIYPDGREIALLDGIQRVKFREGFGETKLLPSGEVGKLTIDLWAISVIINKGHRIGLHVSSSNYPRFEVNPNNGDDFPTDDNLTTVDNAIHWGEGQASALVLPVRK